MLDTIKKQLKESMILKDKDRITTLRNILAKLKLKEIEKKESLTDLESLKVLQSMSKQLNDSIKQYRDGNRDDLADAEAKELEILNEFLPEPMSEEEIIKISNNYETLSYPNKKNPKSAIIFAFKPFFGFIFESDIYKTSGARDTIFIKPLLFSIRNLLFS